VNSGHPLFFRANASCSKILNVKSIFPTAKNFRATLFFRASASCSKILNDKKYMFNTVKNIRATRFFRASACKLLKTPECEKYIPYSEKFQGTLYFSVQAQVTLNSWIIKNTCSIQCKILGQVCFSEQAHASCSKLLNVKTIFHTAKTFWATLFFSASASCSKLLNV